MLFCIHYLLKRPTDCEPVKHVINDVPGRTAEEAVEAARKMVTERGGEYVSTRRVVKTQD